jgi:hypothetical protein
MKRGPKPKGRVSTEWSSKLGYAVGLITADGCLSKDGRHIDLTSKDMEQIISFQKCLNLNNKISPKYSSRGDLSYRIAFGDVLFYQFLLNIGLSPRKSNTISSITIPDKYFFDFIRGYFDGDGTSYSYNDPKYPSSYRFYVSFTSGSLNYLKWLQGNLNRLLNIGGFICHNKNNAYPQLKYSKTEAVIFCDKMYRNKEIPSLERKRLKIEASLCIINKCRGGETGRHARFRSV